MHGFIYIQGVSVNVEHRKITWGLAYVEIFAPQIIFERKHCCSMKRDIIKHLLIRYFINFLYLIINKSNKKVMQNLVLTIVP